MKNNFVLVDFENVQPKNVSLLSGRSFKIRVFVGASQARIPFELARALHAFGPDAEYIEIDGNGRKSELRTAVIVAADKGAFRRLKVSI